MNDDRILTAAAFETKLRGLVEAWLSARLSSDVNVVINELERADELRRELVAHDEAMREKLEELEPKA